MTKQNNAAQVAVQAAALPTECAVVWVPCLLIEEGNVQSGAIRSYYERAGSQHYATHAQALAAATRAANKHPKAIGISCLREVVEVYA